jgi:hypothetical protein
MNKHNADLKHQLWSDVIALLASLYVQKAVDVLLLHLALRLRFQILTYNAHRAIHILQSISYACMYAQAATARTCC